MKIQFPKSTSPWCPQCDRMAIDLARARADYDVVKAADRAKYAEIVQLEQERDSYKAKWEAAAGAATRRQAFIDQLPSAEAMRTALYEIRDARLDLPPEDIVANMRATATVALRVAAGDPFP